jgi:hypothetical protein
LFAAAIVSEIKKVMLLARDLCYRRMLVRLYWAAGYEVTANPAITIEYDARAAV